MSETDPAIRVLLVEDDEAVRLGLRRYLKKVGFEVEVASDGLAAIKLLLDKDVDVIVSDYRMEVLGGDYWVRFLRRYCSDKRVVITSGFLKPDVSIDFPVLLKPFEFAKLASLIRDDAPKGG